MQFRGWAQVPAFLSVVGVSLSHASHYAYNHHHGTSIVLIVCVYQHSVSIADLAAIHGKSINIDATIPFKPNPIRLQTDGSTAQVTGASIDVVGSDGLNFEKFYTPRAWNSEEDDEVINQGFSIKSAVICLLL